LSFFVEQIFELSLVERDDGQGRLGEAVVKLGLKNIPLRWDRVGTTAAPK